MNKTKTNKTDQQVDRGPQSAKTKAETDDSKLNTKPPTRGQTTGTQHHTANGQRELMELKRAPVVCHPELVLRPDENLQHAKNKGHNAQRGKHALAQHKIVCAVGRDMLFVLSATKAKKKRARKDEGPGTNDEEETIWKTTVTTKIKGIKWKKKGMKRENEEDILRSISSATEEPEDDHWTNGLRGFCEQRIKTKYGGRHGMRSVVDRYVSINNVGQWQTEQTERSLRNGAIENHEEGDKKSDFAVAEGEHQQRHNRLEHKRVHDDAIRAPLGNERCDREHKHLRQQERRANHKHPCRGRPGIIAEQMSLIDDKEASADSDIKDLEEIHEDEDDEIAVANDL
eukprot:m.748861 g.748861  ORF g.748861 m.748861 type:complete len:342 (-) comp58974_c0_seq21:1103-2128(-)